jgi:hypothetical protein
MRIRRSNNVSIGKPFAFMAVGAVLGLLSLSNLAAGRNSEATSSAGTLVPPTIKYYCNPLSLGNLTNCIEDKCSTWNYDTNCSYSGSPFDCCMVLDWDCGSYTDENNQYHYCYDYFSCEQVDYMDPECLSSIPPDQG